ARKQTEDQLQKLNQDKFEEEIRLQRVRSLQVIEAQENERKRIARDIHDGIGQMLTALKFNLESLNARGHSLEKTEEKIKDLKFLSTKLIKGVRIATFNLTPPELSDYGISTALAKLSVELKKLTAENILFENKTNYQGRLPAVVETNLYRVIQEAVNNAIKYAQASYILVTLAHSENLLSFVVEDDGVGFESQEVPVIESSEDGTNMGLAFMKERIHYINGRIFIRSQKNQGTRITINLPLASDE
ncbi:MAG: sensor histidine kinase, partial [Bacteroidota bacterium]